MTYQFTEIALADMAPMLWFIGGMISFAAAWVMYEDR